MKSKIQIRLLCLLLCLAVLLPCVSAMAETTKVATYLLRLREKPSASAKVLDAYPRGTKVTILKKGAEWTRVQVHSKTGEEKEVIFSAKEDTAKAVSSGETAYIIKGVKLNLRSTAGTDGDIIASFRGGTSVTILKKGRNWSFVEVKGLQGYMSTDYLTSEKE